MNAKHIAAFALALVSTLSAQAQSLAPNWLVPGDAVLLAAAKAGYEGQKVHGKPVAIRVSTSMGFGNLFNNHVGVVAIVTPTMIAQQLGVEKRKEFKPSPEDTKVLEVSGLLGIRVELILIPTGNDSDVTTDAELALQVENQTIRPTMKEVTGRNINNAGGLSTISVDIMSAFPLTTPTGHAKLLIHWNTGREDVADIDFDKLSPKLSK
jgi:hypothetical protein